MKEFRSRRLRVWENINRTMQEFKVLLLGYRSYTALLTQSGTDAPIATVLENTLGSDIIWTYNSPGIYFGNLVNSFPEDKTYVQIVNSNSGAGASGNFILLDAYRNDNDSIGITVQDIDLVLQISPNVDNILLRTPIEIRVYN